MGIFFLPQNPAWVSWHSFPPLRPRWKVAACPDLWASPVVPCSTQGSSRGKHCSGLKAYYPKSCLIFPQLPLEGSAAGNGSPPVWRKPATPRCSPCCGHLEKGHKNIHVAFPFCGALPFPFDADGCRETDPPCSVWDGQQLSSLCYSWSVHPSAVAPLLSALPCLRTESWQCRCNVGNAKFWESCHSWSGTLLGCQVLGGLSWIHTPHAVPEHTGTS